MDDDDDEDISPPPEDMPPQGHQMVPPHLQNQPGFQHIRHQAPSASPPVPNGLPFQPRHSTPQPHMGSRPSSRNNMRRMSSSLVPQQPPHATPPPSTQNGFAYMPNPPIYNPQANPNMSHQPPPPQFQQFQQHGPPPPAQHQAVQQAQQQYIQERRRQSVPPAFPSQSQKERPQPPARPSPQPEPQPPPPKAAEIPSPPQPKHLSSKSRSIFTPIDDRGSVLSQHFGFPSVSEAPRSDGNVKAERGEVNATRPSGPPNAAMRAMAQPQRTQSGSSIGEIGPPSRTNSAKMIANRPRLKVQIPSENSDGGSATAESSPRESGGGTTATPAKGSSDTNHSSGVVLPPPSPSASALLSAGASGPPNPFARPPPPSSSGQNQNAYATNNNIDTPMSALPSRFMSDALLPSPSSFYPGWDFGNGRTGPDSNVLPSPLNFPTPVMQSGPGFPREADEMERKRKGSSEGATENGKRVKI